LNFKIVARIHAEKCIGCELCYIACWDGAHQCIHLDGAHSTPPAIEAASRARISVTPIPKLDRASHGLASRRERPRSARG
jgi:dihydropyrimidine dehydrogenase (NAD+) subunit PreA